MLFRSYAYNNGLVSDHHQNNISEMVAKMWRVMPENEKQIWRQRAAQVKEEHKKRYPGYRFIPGQKMSERSAMAPTPKASGKQSKTATTTSRPMPANSPVTQPEIPFFVVPRWGPIHFETTQSRFDDHDTLSDDSVSASIICEYYHRRSRFLHMIFTQTVHRRGRITRHINHRF